MDELKEMVEMILRRFRRPYPQDITDQVFLTIERDGNLLRNYLYLAVEQLKIGPQGSEYFHPADVFLVSHASLLV